MQVNGAHGAGFIQNVDSASVTLLEPRERFVNRCVGSHLGRIHLQDVPGVH
jgi:hypothetical protein